ncbi:MAG: helix-turn-helix transcriptional regulator [Butyricicoccus sp.]|nr:helix-turn-helix transcriptional regulator [Butyricicoccus sp.]
MNAYMKIDGQAIRKYANIKGATLSELSVRLGRTKNFVSNCIASGKMLTNTAKLLADTLGVEVDDLAAHEIAPEPPERDGWSVDLDIRSATKLRIVYRFNGEQVAQAWASINGNWQADLFEAIARATAYISETENQKRMEE